MNKLGMAYAVTTSISVFVASSIQKSWSRNEIGKSVGGNVATPDPLLSEIVGNL